MQSFIFYIFFIFITLKINKANAFYTTEEIFDNKIRLIIDPTFKYQQEINASLQKEKCNNDLDNTFGLKPIDKTENAVYPGGIMGISSSSMSKIVSSLIEMAQNEISRLVLPGPYKIPIDLGISKLLFTMSNIMVNEFIFNNGIEFILPKTDKEQVYINADNIYFEMQFDYKATCPMPKIDLAGLITAKLNFKINISAFFFIQEFDKCPYKMKIKDESTISILFNSIELIVSDSSILNALASFLASALKSILNSILESLLRDVLINELNKHLDSMRPSDAIWIGGITPKPLYIDIRMAKMHITDQFFGMDYAAYLYNETRLDERLVPTDGEQTPSVIYSSNDVVYTFGIDSVRSALYEFRRMGWLDTAGFTISRNIDKPKGDPNFIFTIEDKQKVYTLGEKGILPKIFPEILNYYSASSNIIFDTYIDDITATKIGPGGVLVDFSYTIHIKSETDNSTILKYKGYHGTYAAPMGVTFLEYTDSNQKFLHGYFYLTYNNYKGPLSVEVIENPYGFKITNENLELLKYYSTYIQNIMHSPLTAESYARFCIQRQAVLFASSAVRSGFIYRRNYIQYWEDVE